MAKFKARIGRQRLTGTVDPTEASYTRSIREQMRVIEQNVTNFFSSVKSATPTVLKEALQPTFEKSQTYVPVDTGDLKESGYLEVSQKGDLIRAEIGYGKAGDPFYAAYVHERTDVAHAAPTRSKFLQAAVMEDMQKLNRRLVAAYRKETGIR